MGGIQLAVRKDEFIAHHFVAVFVVTDTVLPGIIVIVFIAQTDNTALVRKIALVQVFQVVFIHFNRNCIMSCGLCCSVRFCSGYGLCSNILDDSAEVLTIVAVPHLHQTSESAPQRAAVKVQLGSVRPVHIIQAVNIRLVNFLMGTPGHTFQAVVVVAVNQHLSACYAHNESAAAGFPVRVICVRNFCLCHVHIHDLGKLIHQKCPSVPKLVGIDSCELYGVDLLVQCGDLSGQGVDLINLYLDLQICILLQLFQVPGHAVKILCQRARISHKLLFGGHAVGIFQQLFHTCDNHLVKNCLKACVFAVVVKIGLDLLHIILFLAVFAHFRIVIPVSIIVKFIPNPFNGQCLHTCTCTAVCLEYPQSIGRLLRHLLSAESFCLYIGNVVGCGVQCRIAGQQPRICNG